VLDPRVREAVAAFLGVFRPVSATYPRS